MEKRSPRRSAKRLPVALAVVASAALFVAFLGIGLFASTALTAESAFSPAESGEATYEIGGISVQYPYTALGRVGSPPDPSQAGVSFTATWSTDSYPGEVTCLVTLLSGTEEVVGETLTNIDSLEPEAYMPSNLPVPVNGRPSGATIVCEAGSSQTEPGYALTIIEPPRPDPQAGSQTGSVLSIRAQWLRANPVTHMCRADFILKDGTSVSFPFTLDVPDGAVFPLHVGSVESTDVARVVNRCRPFSGDF